MLATPARRPCVLVFLASCCLLAGAPAVAAPRPLTREEQAKIDDAIARGVAFLKGAQNAGGDFKWKMYRDGRFPAAQCALPAYALLEAGVPAADPVIRKAADYVRSKAAAADYTYELALVLLFLDRLGDARDDRLIRTLAVRLLAGQHHSGGWSYRCPVLAEPAEQELLRASDVLAAAMRDRKQTREQALLGLAVPPALQPLPAFRPSALLAREPSVRVEPLTVSASRVILAGRTDNANTQFALLGLWAARRHDVPVGPAFELLVGRFERSQAQPSGLWWYTLDEESGSRSMICAGLMALAVGRGLRLPTAGAPAAAPKDVHVLRGLAALARRVGRPAGRMDGPVPPHDLYFLWSLERVAVLCDLETIGDRDWYRWGAESLVANQARGGWWTGASPTPEWGNSRNYDYKAALSTAFALLFLKRAHPMKDLTAKLPLTGAGLNDGLARLRPEDRFPARPTTTTPPDASRREK